MCVWGVGGGGGGRLKVGGGAICPVQEEEWRVKAMAGGEEVEEGVRGKSRKSRLKNALGNDRMCHLSCSGRMSGEMWYPR